MNMCIQFMRCAWHKIALFLCGDLTRFELVDFYILRYGTGYVAFIAGTRRTFLLNYQGWEVQTNDTELSANDIERLGVQSNIKSMLLLMLLQLPTSGVSYNFGNVIGAEGRGSSEGFRHSAGKAASHVQDCPAIISYAQIFLEILAK